MTIELLYQILDKIGYTHPIRPPLTRIPMGWVLEKSKSR
jgi:hypothetical protein